jgi:hypothetical protein
MSKFAGLALSVDMPSRMPILHPKTLEPLVDEEGREAFIELYSRDSAKGREQARRNQIKRLASRQRKKSEIVEITEEEQTDMLVALTSSWHLVSLDGKALKVDCTPDNVRDLYTEPAMAWLRDQVENFTWDRANFLPASSTS